MFLLRQCAHPGVLLLALLVVVFVLPTLIAAGVVIVL